MDNYINPEEKVNTITIEGTVSLKPQVFTTPLGVQKCEWKMQHQSEKVDDADFTRKVWLHFIVSTSDPAVIARVANLDENTRLLVTGFITARKERGKSATILVIFANDVQVLPDLEPSI